MCLCQKPTYTFDIAKCIRPKSVTENFKDMSGRELPSVGLTKTFSPSHKYLSQLKPNRLSSKYRNVLCRSPQFGNDCNILFYLHNIYTNGITK